MKLTCKQFGKHPNHLPQYPHPPSPFPHKTHTHTHTHSPASFKPQHFLTNIHKALHKALVVPVMGKLLMEIHFQDYIRIQLQILSLNTLLVYEYGHLLNASNTWCRGFDVWGLSTDLVALPAQLFTTLSFSQGRTFPSIKKKHITKSKKDNRKITSLSFRLSLEFQECNSNT